MRKYLGSITTAFAAIVAPLFLCCPLIFGIFALHDEISVATVFLMAGCIACSFVWGLYINNIRNQLYSWAFFTGDSVQIATCLSRGLIMDYDKCKGCGIAFYIHGNPNSKIGIKIYYIYLSYNRFDEYYRSKINLWLPSPTQIKVQFSKKLYNYLLVVLPRRQSQMLYEDYERLFG